MPAGEGEGRLQHGPSQAAGGDDEVSGVCVNWLVETPPSWNSNSYVDWHQKGMFCQYEDPPGTHTLECDRGHSMPLIKTST